MCGMERVCWANCVAALLIGLEPNSLIPHPSNFLNSPHPTFNFIKRSQSSPARGSLHCSYFCCSPRVPTNRCRPGLCFHTILVFCHHVLGFQPNYSRLLHLFFPTDQPSQYKPFPPFPNGTNRVFARPTFFQPSRIQFPFTRAAQ